MRGTITTLVLYMLGAFGALCVPACAQPQKAGNTNQTTAKEASAKTTPAKAEPKVQPKIQPVSQAAKGVRVFIDPETGQVREPDPGELGVSSQGVDAPPQPIVGVNGMEGLRLTDAQMSFAMVRKNADGTVSFECVDGPGKAAAAPAAPSKPVPTKEKLDVK